MRIFLLLLLLLLASSIHGWTLQNSRSRSYKCFEQTGIALGWAAPFSFCGLLSWFVEARSNEANLYRVLTDQTADCSTVCVNLTTTQFHFSYEFCSSAEKVPLILLASFIDKVGFTVDKLNRTVAMYGCSRNFRTWFKAVPGTICTTKGLSCKTIFTYERNRMDLPYPFEAAQDNDEKDAPLADIANERTFVQYSTGGARSGEPMLLPSPRILAALLYLGWNSK